MDFRTLENVLNLVKEQYRKVNAEPEETMEHEEPPQKRSEAVVNPALPPNGGPKNEKTNKTFPGFQPHLHIGIFGATNSGKTTNTITQTYKGLFNFVDMVMLNGGEADAKNIENYHRAYLSVIQLEKHQDPTNKFAYFGPSDRQKVYMMAKDPKYSSMQKLVIFDDAQASSNKSNDEMANFVVEAKNANCTCMIMMHFAYNGEVAKKIRGSCSYYVLYNQTESDFNRILGLSAGNPLWKKYSMISDKLDRVLIFDKHEREYYYGTLNYADFNPVVPSPPGVAENEQQPSNKIIKK